jgi:hypothetical protein
MFRESAYYSPYLRRNKQYPAHETTNTVRNLDCCFSYMPEKILAKTTNCHWLQTCFGLAFPVTQDDEIAAILHVNLPSNVISPPPVYETCEEIRQTILYYINYFPFMTPTRFARIIGSNVYNLELLRSARGGKVLRAILG